MRIVGLHHLNNNIPSSSGHSSDNPRTKKHRIIIGKGADSGLATAPMQIAIIFAAQFDFSVTEEDVKDHLKKK